eukprot:tig00020961_g16753.t1
MRTRRDMMGFYNEESRPTPQFYGQRSAATQFVSPVALVSGFNTEVLSNISRLAIKAVLRRCDRINVRVVSNNLFTLLGGTVDEVVVEGQGWESPGGLSCRRAALRGHPPKAVSKLVLNAQDFNRFVSSPILRDTFPRLLLEGHEIRFVGVKSIDESSVASMVEYGGRALVCTLRVQPGGKIAFESAEEGEPVGPVDAAAAAVDAAAVGRELEGFFNGMTVDLSGLILKVARFEIHKNSMAVSAEGQITRFPSALVSI